MSDVDEDEEEYEGVPIPGQKFSALALAVVALESVGDFVYGLKFLLARHHNWQVQRQMFQDQARLEIEALVAGAE